MITWIQTVLQKHNKPVFIVLLIVITIAFVFTIGQIPFFGDRYRSEASKQDFYGFDLSDQNVISNLSVYATYDALLLGTRPTDIFIYRQAYLRYVAKNVGIQQVSQAELDAYIKNSPAFLGANGKYDEALFKKFIEERAARVPMEMLTQVFAQNALLAKVEKLLGGPGYVFKSDVLKRFEQREGTWAFNMATVSYEKFKPEVKPTVQQLETFYKENAPTYKVGEGVVLETVYLPVEAFAKEVSTPTEADLKSFYGANVSKYVEYKNGTPETQPFAKVQAKVKADFLKEAAMHKAMSKAEEIALKIYNAQAKKSSPAFKKVIADAKLQLKKSKEIRTTNMYADSTLPASVVKAGLKLDEQNFYADPVVDDKGVWLVFLAEKLAAYQPKLDTVKKEVEKAFVESEKQRLFAEYGKKLDKAFEDGLKAGKSFDAIAKENKVAVESVKNFSFMNFASASASVKSAYQVLSMELPKLKVGAVSKMQVMGADGYIVNLVSFKKPVVDNAKLEGIEKNYAEGFSRMTIQSVLQDAISNAVSEK